MVNMSDYGIHPSDELVRLFRDRPYQGCSPEKARFVVIGNDANYSPQISNHPFFSKILEYHQDGISFWKKNLVHHPFLHAEYPFDRTRGGFRYHKNFSKLGLDSTFADQVSFVELLEIPTTGNTGENKKLFFELMSPGHLCWLEDVLFSGQRKFVLINQTLSKNVFEINKRFGELSKLRDALENSKFGDTISLGGESQLYNGYSFSHTVTNQYLAELSTRVKGFLRS